jgi:hypothetical protein
MLEARGVTGPLQAAREFLGQYAHIGGLQHGIVIAGYAQDFHFMRCKQPPPQRAIPLVGPSGIIGLNEGEFAIVRFRTVSESCDLLGFHNTMQYGKVFGNAAELSPQGDVIPVPPKKRTSIL